MNAPNLKTTPTNEKYQSSVVNNEEHGEEKEEEEDNMEEEMEDNKEGRRNTMKEIKGIGMTNMSRKMNKSKDVKQWISRRT